MAGMIIGRESRENRRLGCLNATLSAINPRLTAMGQNSATGPQPQPRAALLQSLLQFLAFAASLIAKPRR
jgi:hypothetical protein